MIDYRVNNSSEQKTSGAEGEIAICDADADRSYKKSKEREGRDPLLRVNARVHSAFDASYCSALLLF